MSKLIQAVRGMGDILPEDTPLWQYVEDTARSVLSGYGYSEIRMPVVEKTELFKRSIGEVTDIVEKEMYTFLDRNGDSLTLRPEGTAGCVRAGIERALLHNQVRRLWYAGPMFRHERPQKGRYRQFHQIGVEAFGLDGPDVDAELILSCARLWSRLELRGLTLELNSLGSPQAREAYRQVLVAYFRDNESALDEDSRRRLESNPLRILDSKNPHMGDLLAGAPRLPDYLDDESAAHFEALRAVLDGAGIEYRLNPGLVRGLDYYTRTVFEWTTTDLGAQGTVCAGGRYDGLVGQIGGRPTPAVGYALGMERLIELLRTAGTAAPESDPHCFVAAVGQGTLVEAHRMAEALRDRLPGLRLVVDAGAGGFKGKLKRADRSGARLALIVGETEMSAGQVSLKHLREDRAQETLERGVLDARLGELLFGLDTPTEVGRGGNVSGLPG